MNALKSASNYREFIGSPDLLRTDIRGGSFLFVFTRTWRGDGETCSVRPVFHSFLGGYLVLVVREDDGSNILVDVAFLFVIDRSKPIVRFQNTLRTRP